MPEINMSEQKASPKTLKERLKERIDRHNIQTERGVDVAWTVPSLEQIHKIIDEEFEGLVASLTDLRKEYDDKLKVAEKENELLEGCYYEGRRDGVNEVLGLLGVEESKQN